MKQYLPLWIHDWLGALLPTAYVLIVLVVAWLLRTLARRVIHRFAQRYTLPDELVIGARRTLGFVVWMTALLMILQHFGVSGTVLWTAFTGFAAVAAVAFFAAWSVLSNLFCALLILTARPFRIGDYVELLESGDKPGLKGKVIDINLVHTTLRETESERGQSVLQVPNNLFFQRTVRRWRSGIEPPVALDGPKPAAPEQPPP